jgi:transposase
MHAPVECAAMASYLPYEPMQQMLLPEALQDWLPEGHLAYFISDTVDGLDLQAFHARYPGGGPRNQPFHPAMMVKVLVYAYATGVFSSRKIAKKLQEDVAFRVLAAGNLPAHRTISDFRAFHLKELSELFVQVVRLAREMGLVKLGTIAVDGTKVKANASRHKAMSYSHMLKAEAELKAQIAALLDKARSADEAEKNEPELDIPAEIARRQDRLNAIAQARARRATGQQWHGAGGRLRPRRQAAAGVRPRPHPALGRDGGQAAKSRRQGCLPAPEGSPSRPTAG